MKIYVVTSGCYSDFHIDAMFSTREKAQKYIDAAKFDDWDEINGITEYDIDSASTEPPKSMIVSGYFEEDELDVINFDDGKEEPWSFSMEMVDGVAFDVTFTGNIAVRPGETAEQFHERAEKVVTDKYFEWKASLHG